MKLLINWEKENYVSDIKMTVGLAALNSKRILWLPLESLRNQEDVDFDWELIIMEEHGESVGLVRTFINKFPRCCRIKYYAVNPKTDGRKKGKYKGKYILIDKWLFMAKDSDPNSQIFVFQDADDYSPSKRLSIHRTHFSNKKCRYSTQDKGLFLWLQNGQKMWYHGSKKDRLHKDFFTVNHLNKAVRIKDLRRVKPCDKNRRIDTYIRGEIEKILGVDFTKEKYLFNSRDVNEENWKTGFFTDGLNNISQHRRKNYQRPEWVFVEYKKGCQKNNYTSMKDYIPDNVMKFVKKFKK